MLKFLFIKNSKIIFNNKYKNINTYLYKNSLIKNFSIKKEIISENPKFKIEKDNLGEINIPNEKFWGAKTQRSLQNFPIGTKEDKMPISIIRSIAIIKKCEGKVK